MKSVVLVVLLLSLASPALADTSFAGPSIRQKNFFSRVGSKIAGIFVNPVAEPLPLPAGAQTGVTITGLTLQVYNAATPVTGTPTGTPQAITWPQPVGTCNLTATPPVVGTVVNPSTIELDDPAVVTKVCRINFAAYLATFAAATGYKATATFTYSDGAVSARSAATGPFDEVAAHPAPTGLGVRP